MSSNALEDPVAAVLFGDPFAQIIECARGFTVHHYRVFARWRLVCRSWFLALRHVGVRKRLGLCSAFLRLDENHFLTVDEEMAQVWNVSKMQMVSIIKHSGALNANSQELAALGSTRMVRLLDAADGVHIQCFEMIGSSDPFGSVTLVKRQDARVDVGRRDRPNQLQVAVFGSWLLCSINDVLTTWRLDVARGRFTHHSTLVAPGCRPLSETSSSFRDEHGREFDHPNIWCFHGLQLRDGRERPLEDAVVVFHGDVHGTALEDSPALAARRIMHIWKLETGQLLHGSPRFYTPHLFLDIECCAVARSYSVDKHEQQSTGDGVVAYLQYPESDDMFDVVIMSMMPTLHGEATNRLTRLRGINEVPRSMAIIPAMALPTTLYTPPPRDYGLIPAEIQGFDEGLAELFQSMGAAPRLRWPPAGSNELLVVGGDDGLLKMIDLHEQCFIEFPDDPLVRRVGGRARIEGLQGSSHLNGTVGRVIGVDLARERLVFQPDDALLAGFKVRSQHAQCIDGRGEPLYSELGSDDRLCVEDMAVMADGAALVVLHRIEPSCLRLGVQRAKGRQQQETLCHHQLRLTVYVR